MEMNYCRRCGTVLTKIADDVYDCVNGHRLYSNAAPGTSLWIINDKQEVLITIRGDEPGKGRFDSPGGFNDGAETFEHTAAREIQEELGLGSDDYTTPQYILSDIDTYMFDGEKRYVLSAVFWSRLIGSPTITTADDVAEAHFIPIADINPDDIFFDAPRAGFIALRDSGLYNS